MKPIEPKIFSRYQMSHPGASIPSINYLSIDMPGHPSIRPHRFYFSRLNTELYSLLHAFPLFGVISVMHKTISHSMLMDTHLYTHITSSATQELPYPSHLLLRLLHSTKKLLHSTSRKQHPLTQTLLPSFLLSYL